MLLQKSALIIVKNYATR